MKGIRTPGAILAVFLLVAAAAAARAHADTEKSVGQPMEVTLVGRLCVDGHGGFLLVDSDTAEMIAIVGPAELAHHVGTMVEVTGRWVEEPQRSYFEVSSVRPA